MVQKGKKEKSKTWLKIFLNTVNEKGAFLEIYSSEDVVGRFCS